jgi:NADPH:quinone reductase-like Zn-dependent oxidoreductase
MEVPMLGCVVGQLGDAPEPASRPQPDRLPGQSLVKVTVAALNPIDLLISSGKHPAGAPPVPHVPGIQAVGLVMESDRYPAGTRVRVSVAGGYVSGTLAEYVTAPDLACVQVPGDLADNQAAAIGVVGISSLISLRDRVALGKGESVLVLGATGALGLASLQVARHLGADRVIAAGRNPERLAALGARADGTALLDAEHPAVRFARGLTRPADRSTSSSTRSAGRTRRRPCGAWPLAGATLTSASWPAGR